MKHKICCIWFLALFIPYMIISLLTVQTKNPDLYVLMFIFAMIFVLSALPVFLFDTKMSRKVEFSEKEEIIERERLIKDAQLARTSEELELEQKKYDLSLERGKLQVLEKEAIEKLKRVVSISDRIQIDMLKNILNLDDIRFARNIFNWAEAFNFTVDGDYLIINKDTVTEFIEALDKQFEMWTAMEKEKIGKIETQSSLTTTITETVQFCTKCGKQNEKNAKFCVICGKKF
ncbi:MAG: zinc ribbon domain-containing protein [Candidatus Hermodarchaeota archaeon]